MIHYIIHEENNTYIFKTLALYGSNKELDSLFKMNCVRCNSITARGLVKSELNSIRQYFNDKRNHKTSFDDLTTPFPSFEIDLQNVSKFIKVFK